MEAFTLDTTGDAAIGLMVKTHQKRNPTLQKISRYYALASRSVLQSALMCNHKNPLPLAPASLPHPAPVTSSSSTVFFFLSKPSLTLSLSIAVSLGEHLTLFLIDQPNMGPWLWNGVCRRSQWRSATSAKHTGHGRVTRATMRSTASEWPVQKGSHRSVPRSSRPERKKERRGEQGIKTGKPKKSERRGGRRAGVTLQPQTPQTKGSHKQTINKLPIMDTSKWDWS